MYVHRQSCLYPALHSTFKWVFFNVCKKPLAFKGVFRLPPPMYTCMQNIFDTSMTESKKSTRSPRLLKNRDVSFSCKTHIYGWHFGSAWWKNLLTLDAIKLSLHTFFSVFSDVFVTCNRYGNNLFQSRITKVFLWLTFDLFLAYR